MFTFLQGINAAYFSSEEGFVAAGTEPVILAKRFNGKKSLSPQICKFYEVDSINEPTTLEEVYDLLDQYSERTDVALVRAQPNFTNRQIRRVMQNFKCDVNSNIIHMDIDGIALPDNIEWYDIAAQARYVLGLLEEIEPEIFDQSNAFVAKASGSAGVKKGIRIHLYLKSDKPVCNPQLKYVSTKVNKAFEEKYGKEILDTSVYDKVHVIYTANPIFKNEFNNPFQKHSRLVQGGGSEVVLPAYMPRYESDYSNVKITKKHHDYITGIDGVRSPPTNLFAQKLKKLSQATDNVFMKHSISVYASAIEEGVDIGWLDDQVQPILEDYTLNGGKRNVSAYINNAKNAALKIILSRSLRRVGETVEISGDNPLPVRAMKTDSKEEDRYLHIKDLPPEDCLSFVKASLGTGKTTAVQRWLKNDFEGRFLSVTNTVSLVEGNAKKLDSGVYNNIKDFNAFRNKEELRMSTTIHSLHRFKDMIDEGGLDMLFIDECDAVMNDILFSDLIKDRDKCISTLSICLQSAKYVILSDGDISNETIEAYAKLCDPAKQVVLFNHDRKMLEGATATELVDDKSIWAAMQGALEMGEKCLLVSDCSPDELNEKGITLRNLTGTNIKEVHKNSTADADIKEILTYGNDALIDQKIDGLLCSPSVTSGVDFSYFDSVFIITRDSAIHAPNLRFQALRRDRGAQTIYYFTSRFTEGFRTGSESYDEKLGWLSRCRKVFARRREKECQRYMSTFRMLLRDQGCAVVIDPGSWGDIESSKSEYKEERINAILSSTAMFTVRRHNDAFEAKQNIVRYYDDVEDISGVTEEAVTRYLKEKPVERAAIFHKVHKRFWKDIRKCTEDWFPLIEAIKQRPHEWYQDTGMDVRLDGGRTRMLVTRMGLSYDEPGDFGKIISWYRTYCKCNNYQIPTYFMTEEELELHEQSTGDIE